MFAMRGIALWKKADNEMYALVDEEFLAKFSNQHLNYMKKLYYSFYAGYCKRIKRKPLTSEDFFRICISEDFNYTNFVALIVGQFPYAFTIRKNLRLLDIIFAILVAEHLR